MSTRAPGITFYFEDLKIIDHYSDAKLGKLIKLLIAHGRGENCEVPPSMSDAYGFMAAKIDRDMDKYAKRVETNRANGSKKKRPLAIASDGKRLHLTETETETETKTETETEYPMRRDDMRGVLMEL